MQLGECIQLWRRRKGLRQRDLAQQLYMDHSRVSRLESGEIVPTREVVESLVRVLNLSAQESQQLWNLYVQTMRANGHDMKTLAKPTFVIGPPIMDPALFFGREMVLTRIFQVLSRLPLQHVAIIGPKQSGKTSLLYYLQQITRTDPAVLRPRQHTNWLPQPELYHWVYVDFRDPRLWQPEKILQHILISLGFPIPKPCSLFSFLDVVGEKLNSPTVILLDEISLALAVPEFDMPFWSGLRSLCNLTSGQLGFVLTASASPITLATSYHKPSTFFNIFGHVIQLGPLTEGEAMDILSQSLIPFVPEENDWILHHSGRWPVLVQLLALVCLSAKGNHLHGYDWQADGLKRLQEYHYLLS